MTGQARLQFDVPVKNHRQTVLPQACMSLIIRRFVKGRVLPCKRPSFIGQKVTFQRLKGNLLVHPQFVWVLEYKIRKLP